MSHVGVGPTLNILKMHTQLLIMFWCRALVPLSEYTVVGISPIIRTSKLVQFVHLDVCNHFLTQQVHLMKGMELAEEHKFFLLQTFHQCCNLWMESRGNLFAFFMRVCRFMAFEVDMHLSIKNSSQIFLVLVRRCGERRIKDVIYSQQNFLRRLVC